MIKKIITYIVSIIIPLLVGGFSAFLTMGEMNGYEKLIQPPLSPPPVVFPIVWTILFVLMGISSAIVFLSDSKEKNEALWLYVAQLTANFLWTIIYFNFKARFPALMLILVLLYIVVTMTLRFYKISKVSGLLQIPYILWLVFATYLNTATYLLNG